MRNLKTSDVLAFIGLCALAYLFYMAAAVWLPRWLPWW